MPDHTVEEEIEMMVTPDRWPRWPILPVKKRPNNDPVGCIFERVEGEAFIIYGYDGLLRPDPFTVLATYESAVAAVADGWVVD